MLFRSLTAWICLSLAACGATGSRPLPQDQPVRGDQMSEPGEFLQMMHTGPAGSRPYRLYVPSSYDGQRPVPLVVMLHGCSQDAIDLAAGTRMNEHAENEGLLVAYPEQLTSANRLKCWNWYLPEHRRRGAGEPVLIAGIAREVIQRFRVDPERVYVAGISAGGAMSTVLAVAYPDLFAAAASHSGVAYAAAPSPEEAYRVMQQGVERPAANGEAAFEAMGMHARRVPVILIHGEADEVVNVANVRALSSQWLHTYRRVGGASLDTAGDEQVSEQGGRATMRLIVADVDGSRLLERWVVAGLGHAWSGGSTAGTFSDPEGPDASREIVRFFLEHAIR